MRTRWGAAAGFAVCGLLGGCTGSLGDLAGSGADDGAAGDDDAQVQLPQTALEHLTTREYARAVEHLTGYVLTASDAQLYQAGKVSDEGHYVFDRDSTSQVPTYGFVQGAHTLAMRIAETVTADDATLAALLPCEPTGVDDAECLAAFIAQFGRRALRRPLAEEQIESLVTRSMPFAADPIPGEEPHFRFAVDFAMASLLEHPAFLHKIEVGIEEEGAAGVLLDDFEIAARLSFGLWGSVPDDELLDVAESGGLGSADEIEDAAARMLEDDRAREHIENFHAQWFGFATADLPISDDMRVEARALLERVVFDEGRAWNELFTLDETYVDAALAEHYQIEAPAEVDDTGFGWAQYDADRSGILSMGVMLVGSGQEPSIARRGLRVRDRLLCVSLDIPTDLDIDVDAVNDPASGACKWQRSEAHRENGACAYCHEQFDPIGQGLDGYDPQGRPRELEVDIIPEDGIDCPVMTDGAITLDKVTRDFTGPGALGAELARSEDLGACFVQRFFTHAIGRAPSDEDMALVSELADRFASEESDYLAFLLQWVRSDAFRYRRPAATEP